MWPPPNPKWSVEPLAEVEVGKVVDWIKAIDFKDWPQQNPTGEELKPAMVTDLGWHGFGLVVRGVVHDLLRHFHGASPTQWMLSVVMPGHSIPTHVDQQPENWLCRVHVPLITNPYTWFIVREVAYDLLLGRAYCVNTRHKHSVWNEGATPRVHFMFDVQVPRCL